MKKHGGDPDEKRKARTDQYADFEPSPLPVNPEDGAPLQVHIEPPPPTPEINEENSPCVRGPCRYFWHIVTTGPDGGVSGLRQHSYGCIRNQGMETELNDDCVFECNLWDPVDRAEKHERELRRKAYWDANRQERKDEEE